MVQSTKFPESETSSLKLGLINPSRFTINERNPAWVRSGNVNIMINGKDEIIKSLPSSYIAINREWKNGDVITLKVPMELSFENLPDHSPWIAFLYGPIVLAAKTDTRERPFDNNPKRRCSLLDEGGRW